MMTSGHFLHELQLKRQENERYFDKILPSKDFQIVLESLYDHFLRECKSIEMREIGTQMLNYYRLSFLADCYQFLLSSYYLVKSGLTGPAYAALRSCVEKYLAWYALGQDKVLLIRSWIFSLPQDALCEYCTHEKGIQESVAFKTTNGNIELLEEAIDWHEKHMWINEQYKIQKTIENCKPNELREKIESLWYRHGITALYSDFSNYVHIRKYTLKEVVSLHGNSTSNPDSMEFNPLGKKINLQELVSFHLIWLRVGICVLDAAAEKSVDNEGDRVLIEFLNEAYKLPKKIECTVNLKKLIDAMWTWNKRKVPLEIDRIILASGSIEAKEYGEESCQNDIYTQQIPFCKRDPLIHMWREKGAIPIPRIPLYIKKQIDICPDCQVRKEQLGREWMGIYGLNIK